MGGLPDLRSLGLIGQGRSKIRKGPIAKTFLCVKQRYLFYLFEIINYKIESSKIPSLLGPFGFQKIL
jgi:hypothetical protein